MRFAVFLACVVTAPPIAAQALKVVTTTTELRSLVEAVAGARASVAHLIPPNVNAESYQAKPQDVARVKDADLIVRVGLDYDLWLDRLLERARPELRRRGTRHVDASIGITLLDVRGTRVGPSDGHAHGAGNPHYWLDPQNAGLITAAIGSALARIDPDGTSHYVAERDALLAAIERKLPEWEAKLASVRGKPLVAYHNTWAYFARRFGLSFVGTIELREGIAPTAAHLAQLTRQMRDRNVALVVRQPHESAKDAQFVAERGGARVVILAASVGAVPAAADYLALFDYNVDALSSAGAGR